jgi:zinc-ribbon domain
MRYCVACGTPLQPAMTICPNCGRFTPTPNANQASIGTDDRAVTAAASAQQMPFNAPRPVGVAGPSRPSYDNAQAYPPTPPQQTPQPYSPQPFSSNNTPPFTTPPFPASNPQGSKKLPKGTVILLTTMALLIMIGGVALIYYTTIAQPAQFRAQATATVQTILTNNAQATATARGQATATAQAQARASATAQAKAQATATAYQNLYTTATSGTPALTSPMAYQDGASWDVYNAVGGGGCAFAGNALHASIFVQHTYVPCLAQATAFSNFAFQVQMTTLKGDGGGLVFRADDANSKFYLFRIQRDGTFSLMVTSDSKTNTPLIDDTNPAVKTGNKTNLVTIIAKGSNIYLYVNKQFVGSTSDSSYSSGKVGVFADDTDAATDVAFSNANVWTL